jgi:hypothetical protein
LIEAESLGVAREPIFGDSPAMVDSASFCHLGGVNPSSTASEILEQFWNTRYKNSRNDTAINVTEKRNLRGKTASSKMIKYDTKQHFSIC